MAGLPVDRHTLYVGQSRGRHPTHTWNTVPTPGDEVHGNVVVDRRDPGEIVLAAAARVPDNLGADDPLQHARAIVDSAHWLPDAKGIDGPERWRGAADQAAKLHNARERARSREVGHDLGIDL